MASEQAVAYHRTFLSPHYVNKLLFPEEWNERNRNAAEINDFRRIDPTKFEEMRKTLAQLLNVEYRSPRENRPRVGDQGGWDPYREGQPSDGRVVEFMAPANTQTDVIISPITGRIALPISTTTYPAYVDGKTDLKVVVYQKLDQLFEGHATSWELKWSDLIYPYNQGFTPIIDDSWQVIGYWGLAGGPGRSPTLIVPSGLKGKLFDLKEAKDKGVPVFVHSI